MKLGLEFFRSKVAQRYFLLFISCAMIPVLILAVVYYKFVTKEIDHQSEVQIHELSKSIGNDITKHLNLIRNDVEIIASMHRTESLLSFQGLPEEFSAYIQERLSGLMIVTEKDSSELILGQFFNPPELSPDERESIHSGEFLIKTEYLPENRAQIYMGASLFPDNRRGEILWAEVNPQFLGFRGTDYPLPAHTNLCILDQSDNPLFSTLPPPLSFSEEAVLQMKKRHSSQFEWIYRGQKYLAGYRPVPFNQFIADDWKVISSMNKSGMFPFSELLKKIFPFVILASLWLVLYLSTIQIRKSLIPLEKIKEGTKRIAHRDFNSRVKVTSGDEFEEVADSFNAMASQLRKQFKALATMGDIDRAILSVLDTEKIVNTLVARVREVFPCKSASITVVDPGSYDTAQTYIGEAQSDKVKPQEKIKISAEELQILRKNPETLWIKQDEDLPDYLVPLAKQGIKSFLVLPLFLKDGLAGIIALGYVKPPRFSQEDLDNARRLANQVAVAFSNARLVEELNELNMGTLTALARTIDAKSSWTAGHSERSTKLAVRIAESMKLSDTDIHHLNQGGLLHDIGKLGIPPEILDKPAKLTLEERKTMEKHVQLGARILEPISAYSKIIPIILQHHERFNGRGYPGGLKGESINLGARIFAVADAFEAMTSDRPYRKAFDTNDAVGIIKESAGRDFDPQVVNAFLNVMASDGGK
ncbi:MAG: HD domain-containing protein [Candidatus Aminicenantes bacterium]|jgi:putative nucleotidyltransferase with HDIG domain